MTAFDRRSRIDRAAKALDAELSRAADLAGSLVPAQLAGGLTSPMDDLGDAIARVAARYAELGRAIRER